MLWGMETGMKTLLDARALDETLWRLARQISEAVPADAPLGVIGIRRRGDILAERLIARLRELGHHDVAHGALDITLYRDDLAEIGPSAVVRKTEIDFDVNDRYIILVDDVLYTGRSVRAAMDALVDLGRPRAIRLAVLVDRPGRELPIHADFVGVRVEDGSGHVQVMVAELDGQDRVELQ